MKSARHSCQSRRAAISLLLFISVACDDQMSSSPVATSPTSSVSLARLMVASDLVTLKTGDHVEISIPGESTTSARLLWSSDDASIADVDNAGVITARSVGSTTITVSEAGKATDILVTVLPADVTNGTEVDQ